METVGWILIIGGLILGLLGVVILALGAMQLWRQMHPKAAAPAVGGATPSLNDIAKLIDSIVKIPQWLLAILAGDLQIYFGYWLLMGKRLF